MTEAAGGPYPEEDGFLVSSHILSADPHQREENQRQPSSGKPSTLYPLPTNQIHFCIVKILHHFQYYLSYCSF